MARRGGSLSSARPRGPWSVCSRSARRWPLHAIVVVACLAAGSVVVDAAAADVLPVQLVVVAGSTVSAGALTELAEDAGGEVVVGVDSLHAQVIEVAPTRVGQVSARLEARPEIRLVEPVHTYRATGSPNDPGWPTQTRLAQMNLPAVWDATTGSSSVIIAVLDSGVDPVGDLAGKVLPGYNVFTETTATADDDGHGTEVASVAASRGDDHASVAGICWACQILPVKVLDSDGAGSTVGIAVGIRWAADHGANVINLSLGGPDFSQVVEDSVAYARAQGAIVVAAAGNEGPDGGPDFPAAMPGTISVAGSDSPTALRPGSNRGASYVDVAAPWCTPSGPTGYQPFCGTSAATPIVTGVAALLRSQRPDLGEAAIRRIIYTTASPMTDVRYGHLAPDSAMSASAGAPDIGVVERVVPGDTTAPAVSLTDPVPVVGGWLAIPITVSDDREVASASISLYGTVAMQLPLSGRVASSAVFFDTARFPDGPVQMQVDVRDSSGNIGTRAVRTTIDNTRPAAFLLGPANRSTVRSSFDVGVSGRDDIGVKAVLVARNSQLIGGFMGSGPGVFRVPVTSSGTVDIIVASIDLAGNIGLARTTVNAKVAGRVTSSRRR